MQSIGYLQYKQVIRDSIKGCAKGIRCLHVHGCRWKQCCDSRLMHYKLRATESLSNSRMNSRSSLSGPDDQVFIHMHTRSHSVLLGKLACHSEEPLWLLINTAEPARKSQRQPLQSNALSCAMLTDASPDSHMQAPYDRVSCITLGLLVSSSLLHT